MRSKKRAFFTFHQFFWGAEIYSLNLFSNKFSMTYLKSLFVLTLVTVAVGCSNLLEHQNNNCSVGIGQVGNPEYDKYDRYWIFGDQTYDMPQCPDDYYVVFDGEETECVIQSIKSNGFTVVEGPVYGSPAANFTEECPLHDDFIYIGAMKVNGKGDISKIPHVVFSNNLYEFDGRKIGSAYSLYIWYDKDKEDEQIELILTYAKERNLVPVGKISKYSPMFCVFCTNASDGNPLEMSNWFIEETCFTYAEPGFKDEAFPISMSSI